MWSDVSESIRKEKLQSCEADNQAKSYDIIGNITIIRVQKHSERQEKNMAHAIMQTHRHVETVLRQVGAVSDAFRLRQLKWIADETKTENMYKEFGCVSKVDLRQCYFSPRLPFERMRLANTVRSNETIVNMFAGVGTFSILMAKHGRAEMVYSIDVNPSAAKFMKENIRLNRVQSHVTPILGDAREVIVEHPRNTADRVVMPLPEKAYEYLDSALLALKPTGGWIHYYDFEHAAKNENAVEKVKAKVSGKLEKLGVDFVVKFGRAVCRTGPNWCQVVLDVQVRGKR